jgi:drug/metabolite transporter (DMT)-like permease
MLKIIYKYSSIPLVSLVLVIIFWSATPIALVKSFQFLPQEIMASVAVLFATTLLLLIYSFSKPIIIKDTVKLIKGDFNPKDGTAFKNYLFLILLSHLGFFAYPWCLVQALQEAAKVMETSGSNNIESPMVVNMVNYLWPCFAVFFGWLFLKEKVTPRRMGGLFLSFLGAFLAVSSTTGMQDIILKNLYVDFNLSISLSNIKEYWFIIFATLGAVTWGIYTALLPKCNFAKESGDSINSASFYISLLLCSLPIHLLYVVSQWKTLLNFDYHITPTKAAFFVIYCVGSLCIAHPLFAYVRRSKKISLAAIASSTYAVFALGTFLLYFFTNPVITLPISAGFALILTGAYIAQDRYLISPFSGFIIFFFISIGLSAFFSPNPALNTPPNNDSFYSFMEVMTAVFSILSGFILSRAIGHHFEQQKNFQQILQNVGKLSRFESVKKNADEELKEMIKIINLLFSYFNNMGRFYEKHESILQKFETVIEQLAQKLKLSNPRNDISQEENLIDEIRDGAIFWISSRFQKGSHYEWLVLACLIIIMFLIGYRIGFAEPIFRMARSAFDASAVVIILAISDFDAGRPGNALEFLRFSHRFLPRQYRVIDDELQLRLENDIKLEIFVVISITFMGIISLFQY